MKKIITASLLTIIVIAVLKFIFDSIGWLGWYGGYFIGAIAMTVYFNFIGLK